MKISKDTRIAVAMSGGVDSSLAAALLKKEGYNVIGLTFRMWPKEECGSSAGRACCNLEAVTRARAVAEDLDIPYYVFDFSEEFKREVIDYFCGEYLKGLTPNPCVVCNEKIKFSLLLEKAKSLGCEYIATGHYANISKSKKTGRFLLKEGKDKSKDQSYFLFSLKQEQLKHILFPLGAITKARTRFLAKGFKLKTHNTVSSQDICFIQDLNYADYIMKKTGIKIKPGDIVDLNGNILGRHKGIPFYTIGQRRGLGVAYSEPLYVTGIDMKMNRIVVGTKNDVLKTGLAADRLNWIAVEGINKPFKTLARIRYNAKKAKAVVSKSAGGAVKVEFDDPQSAPTPGQAVVFYDKDVVVGGGWIKESN
ncbi:MAG: tRNA 2-thiouridine(34) synthase MnmA [Candidatus Omnitrophica bacterium]|nr:tRNA 2-thiouridine(34) synthase MnmA [Candidatus Omnitrophota bacterium]